MALSQAAIEARRKYQKEWRKKNPGKSKEYNERMWEKKAKQAAALEKETGQQAVDDDGEPTATSGDGEGVTI